MKKIYPFRGILFIITVTLVFFAFTSVTRTQQDNRPFPTSDTGYSTLADDHSVEAPPKTGAELYMKACANCHGADGKGASTTQLGLEVAPPDFTECTFATREPDGDWIAIAHQGGPTRGFSKEMPAFGDALSEDELQKIMDHIRTFCTEDSWPRGELNLPRPLVTEKAYPEDEAVFSTSINWEMKALSIMKLFMSVVLAPEIKLKLYFRSDMPSSLMAAGVAGIWETWL